MPTDAKLREVREEIEALRDRSGSMSIEELRNAIVQLFANASDKGVNITVISDGEAPSSRPRSHFDIMKLAYGNERDRVLALAYERATNLEETARLLRAAYETRNLTDIARLTRSFDMELSMRARACHENLQMIAGFDKHESRVFCQGCQQRIPYGPTSRDIERYEKRLCGACEEMRKERCYCESLAQQGKGGPCAVCKRIAEEKRS